MLLAEVLQRIISASIFRRSLEKTLILAMSLPRSSIKLHTNHCNKRETGGGVGLRQRTNISVCRPDAF